MAEANVTWGAPRIHCELLKLGLQVAQSTVSRYMPARSRKPPSQSWQAFLDNHLGKLPKRAVHVLDRVRGSAERTAKRLRKPKAQHRERLVEPLAQALGRTVLVHPCRSEGFPLIQGECVAGLRRSR